MTLTRARELLMCATEALAAMDKAQARRMDSNAIAALRYIDSRGQLERDCRELRQLVETLEDKLMSELRKAGEPCGR